MRDGRASQKRVQGIDKQQVGAHRVGKWVESLPFQEGSIGSCCVTIHDNHICILYPIIFKLVCG